MTLEESDLKFDDLSSPSFSAQRRAKIKAAVFSLECHERASERMRLRVGDRSTAAGR